MSSFEEYRKKLTGKYGTKQKETEDEEKKKTSTDGSAVWDDSFESTRRKMNSKYGADIDASKVKSWFTDSDSTIKSMSEYYNANDGKWVSNFGGDFTEKLNELLNISSAVGYYLRNNKKEFSDYDSVSKAYSEYRSALEQFATQNSSLSEFYSQFGSEDEYNTWYENYKKEEEYQKHFENVDATKASQGWEKYLSDEEAAKNVLKHDLNNDGKEAWWEKALGYLAGDGGGVVDTTLPNAGVTQTVHDLRADESYRRPNDDWSQEQKNAFGQLYGISPSIAYDFAEETNRRNQNAAEEEALKKIAEAATANGWAGVGNTLGAIATAPFGLADLLGDFAMANAGRPITSDGSVSPFEYSQAVTSGISTHLNEKSGTLNENIPIIGGKGLGDVYGLGTSIAQSMASAYTLGSVGTLISYFGQGAASGIDEALSRGASEGQAALYGVSLGVFEGLAEMVGVDNLFKLGASTTVKGFITNILKQAGAEGMEEGLTSLLSNIADNFIMQDKSNFNALVKQYMAQGMSESDAKKKAWMDSVEGIAFDTIAGAVSGGVSGSVQTTAQNIASKINYENTLRSIDKANINAATEARLVQLGETGDVTKLAEVLAKQASGKSLSTSEKNLIKNSKYGQRVSNELSPTNIESGQYTSKWAESIGTNRINTEAYNKSLYDLASEKAGIAADTEEASVGKNTTAKENAAETKFEVSTDGKTKVGDMEISIKEIASVKDGEVTLHLEDGSTVNAMDIEFGSAEEMKLYAAVSEMNVNAATANAFVKGYDKSMSVDQYTLGFKEAYRYGEYGFPVKEMSAKGFSAMLSESQKKLAYDLGKTDMKYKIDARQNAIAKMSSEAATKKVGKLHYAEGINMESLTQRQQASLKGLETLANALGVDIHIFESQVVDGKRQGANGWFDRKDGSIHLDLHAGLNGEGTMLFTASHELTHFIREWSPSKFKGFADFLLGEYGKHGVSVETLVSEQIAKAKRNGRDIDYDTAYEEVIADSCEALLADGDIISKISKLKAKDKSLWQKIKDFITDLVAKIKAAYEGMTPDSVEGRFVSEMLGKAEKLKKMWTEALVEASENYSSAIAEVIEADAKPISNDEIITDGAVVTNGNGEKYSIRSMKHDISDGQMFRDLMNYCGYTKEQVGELRRQLEDLVEYMNPYRDIVDLNETYDREGRRYSPYKPNSDPLYTISLDFSTQCSKRLLTQYVIEQLQLRENRPMSAEEQMAIRDMLKEYGKVEKGLQVACVMCYVEAARLKAPKQIQKWLDDPATAMRNFFADKNPEFSNYIKEKQADFKESRGYSRDATKKEMSAKDVTALNKIRPKVRAEYNPSAEEMAIIETASSLPNSTYLTAGNLADLSETHPEIYKAYTAFIRTATRSKALETDEPYYYGDSTRDNGNGIIVSDSFIESVNRENGMRFSSWSDWRIQHLLDWITAVIDNSVRGAAMHGYTKYGDEVRVLGKTGMMFNLSGVAGTQTGLNEDGSLNFSETESIDIDEAIALREEFPETAGLQCIGVSRDHIFALLRSDIIDYVIPYHTSGLNATLRRMGDIYGWDDFTQTQHATEDKSIKKENAVDPDHWHQEPVFSEFFVGYDTGLGGVEAMRKSAENYKRMCKERGLKPKFLEFANEPNYWKLLIDRKMVNQQTNTLIKQRAVTPTFDFGVIKGIIDKYVANYDSGLEQRAFNHIVENWDNIPKRIRDLKKQGTTKAKSTKKAIDKLANEPIAVQPKEDKLLSDRDSIDNELSESAEVANALVTHVKKIIENTGSWDVQDVFEYVKDNPNLNFIDRILGKDKAVKKDLESFLAGIDDPKLLHSFSWFMGEAYKRKAMRYVSGRYSSPFIGSVRTFRNAIDARINAIMTEKANGTNLGVKNGEISIDDVKGLFDKLNSNPDMSELAERVFATAKKLGVNIRFANQTFSKKAGGGDAWGDMVELKTSYFNDTAYTDQRKAQTILHELIHSCTVYVMNANGDFAGDVHYSSDKTLNYERISNAATRLNRIYLEIKGDPDFKGQYGIKNAKEMVAELANPDFVELLKKKTLWEKIVDWICELFGFRTGTSAYDNAMACLDYILDNPEVSEYKAHALRVRQAAHNRYGEAFGSTVLPDGQVRYSDRYQAADANTDILSMVEKVGNGNFKANEKVDLGIVSDATAAEIQSITGINVNGFKVAIEARQIEHILKDHGKNGTTDRSMANPSDIAKIEFALKDYDDIRPAGKTQAYTHMVNGKNKTADTVLYEKAIGEKAYYVVQAVPDTKAKTLYIVTAFIGKKGYKKEASQLINAKSPDATSEIGSANTSNKIISQPDEFVNSKFSDRDTDSVSNRSLLANALESVAQNDIERGKLKQYKEKIALIESEQAKLAEIRAKIKELSFAKGARDTQAIKSLQFEANQAANRINTYDKQLLNLESTKALKDVLQREKEMAYKRAEKRGKEALSAYRDKAAKTQRELITRYQDARKKNVEGRKQTAMRHKIKDIVNELNQYLLKGTKDKHVPIELQKAVAEALEAVNMDTVGAEERLANIHKQLEKDPFNHELLERYRRISEQGERMDGKLQALKNAYDEIVNSNDPLIANSHDEVISNTIDKVIKEVGSTPLRDMTLAQLESVYDMYKMVLTTIRNTNKAFKAAKKEEISVIANRVMEEIDGLGKKKPYRTKASQALSKFDWNNLKPVYAFERIGSNTFTEVFDNVRAGEDTWAVDITEAKEFSLEQHKKFNYDSWDFKKRYGFTSSSGMHFELSLDQIMSLYAYSKREQAKDHLKKGGIVIDETTEVTVKNKLGIPVKFNPTEATAYNLSDETLADIIGKLTTEQMAFVDVMQDYLSTTMGDKGNEVSLALYGIKLYKEKHYFPLKSAQQFMAKAKEQQRGEVKIKNSGFSKETVTKASNPIVLTPFMDVWADHVNEMSMYHAFVLPLEDFYRVYNYKTPTSDTMATESVEMYLQNSYGKGATQYIDQLLKDLNGGARVDPTAGIINKLTGLFKKSAVFASLSVVVQQPSAIARATALVDTKYFAGMPSGKHKETWAEVKKYAPVAVIKEMGYFDTGMGQSTVEWIKGDKTWKDKIDDWASKAPAFADELGWCSIWNAVKRETLNTHKDPKPNSEEFLKAVGERFTEVVTKTQVYDSVLSRSANMRSKDTGMKMATAFMGEPTTSLNMLENALTQGKRGNKRYARKAVGSVMASMILNSILVSFVYAGRDDDEDKTYVEKYVGTLTEELLDSFNPLTLIPFVKDIVSIAQGYDVERSDMAVITDIVKAWNNLENDNRSVYRKVEDFAGAIASLFGLPVKNIMRDARGMYNTVNSFINGEKTTGAGIGVAVTEAVTGKEKSNGQLLYDAIISGNTEQADRVKSRFEDQKAIDSAIRKALRDNDPRIKQAAEARYNGDIAEYMRIAKEIIAEGNFSQDNIVSAINSEINALKKGEGTSESTTSDKVKSIYEMSDYYSALEGRDQATAYVVKEDLIKTDMANGKDREEAEADFNSKFASHLRELYEAGDISDSKAEDMLVSYGGKSEEEAFSKVQYWEFRKQYPEYDLSEEAVTKYYNDVEPSGIGIDVYYDYSKQRAKCKGTDSNGDGKTDSGSVKTEVLQVINSLPITKAQKDALYYLNGWAASTIWQAPWH